MVVDGGPDNRDILPIRPPCAPASQRLCIAARSARRNMRITG
jgi:hypothetical protein